jgi:hypothetical protein
MGRITEYIAFITSTPEDRSVRKEEYFHIEVTDAMKVLRRKLRFRRQEDSAQITLFDETLTQFYEE